MKKSFLFFLAVAVFAVVTGCEEKIVSETPPEITFDATEITIPGAGGQCEFVYSIENPVADGKLTANSEDGWMTDFTVASDTMVTFVAEPNESGADRNGLITLKYTYGVDGEVTADVKVSQGVAGAAPEIELGAAPSIPAEGGDFELTYEIINPAADGKVSAASEADWLTLNADNSGVIAITAAANTGDERTAEISVVYEYGDGRIETAAEVTQAAAGQTGSYDYEYKMSYFNGTYYGQEYDVNYNYYTWISDKDFDADGYQQNGGTYYLFDIFAAAAPEDENNPLPPAGTYALSSGSGVVEDMTFSWDYSCGTSIGEDGEYVFDTYFDTGTLTIAYEGGNIVMDAVLTDEDGKIHHVSYTGEAVYDVVGGSAGGDDVLGQDLDIEADNAVAVYVADDGDVMEVTIQFTDMAIEGGYATPPGSILNIDMYMPYNESGELATGTYTVSDSYETNTLFPGGKSVDIYGYESLVGTYAAYCPDYYTELIGLITGGTMTVEGDAVSGYDITCTFTTDNGYSVDCSYSGSLEIQGIPGPYSTLEEDYTLNLDGAEGSAVFYGDYYETGGGNWAIKLFPTTGEDGFMTEIVCEAITFEDGISSGTYKPIEYGYLYPGNYATGYMNFTSGQIYGTNYLGGFDNQGYVSEFAPAMSGDLNITNNGDGTYAISFSFIDDLGYTWDGSWEGRLSLEDQSFGGAMAPVRSSVNTFRDTNPFVSVDKVEMVNNLPIKAATLQPNSRLFKNSASAR